MPRLQPPERPPWRADLPALITRTRLSSYLRVTGDMPHALALYDWNMQAAGAVLATLSMAEIVVRNAMDGALSRVAHAHGVDDWFDLHLLDARTQNLIQQWQRQLPRVIQRNHSSLLSLATFGFWRYLAATRHLLTLWVPGLVGAFPYGPPDVRRNRALVEQLLSNLVSLRNRAAHHEPIHYRDLLRDLDTAVTLASFVHPSAGIWIRETTDIPQVLSVKPR